MIPIQRERCEDEGLLLVGTIGGILQSRSDSKGESHGVIASTVTKSITTAICRYWLGVFSAARSL